jgi:cytoskeletal protein CcmA (bactofilin family)
VGVLDLPDLGRTVLVPARLEGAVGDAVFRGEITSRDTLIVGKTADLQAEITVGTFIISGRMKGNIKASSRVELRSPAQIEGSIETPLLVIEEGVVFNGSLIMKKEQEVAETGDKKGAIFLNKK